MFLYTDLAEFFLRQQKPGRTGQVQRVSVEVLSRKETNGRLLHHIYGALFVSNQVPSSAPHGYPWSWGNLCVLCQEYLLIRSASSGE